MARSIRVLCFALVALTLPAQSAADVGPVPIDQPCLNVLPGVSTCPPPAAAPSTPPQAAGTQGAASSPEAARRFSVASTPQLARSLVAAVNRTRRAHGLRSVVYSAALTEAGVEHASLLASTGQFTHAWPTSGKLFSSWIRSFYSPRGYRSWTAGENLLWASPGFTPDSAVEQWLNSPTHRRVLLSPKWRELGVGVVSATAAPGVYAGRDVQIAAAEFGTRTR